MNISEYAARFRGQPGPAKDRVVAELVVRQEEKLQDLVDLWGRGLRKHDREDVVQSALRWVVEGVRDAESKHADFDGPLREAWDARVLAGVHAGLHRDRTRLESASNNEVLMPKNSLNGEDES